jgi:hypothetical protein
MAEDRKGNVEQRAQFIREIPHQPAQIATGRFLETIPASRQLYRADLNPFRYGRTPIPKCAGAAARVGQAQ